MNERTDQKNEIIKQQKDPYLYSLYKEMKQIDKILDKIIIEPEQQEIYLENHKKDIIRLGFIYYEFDLQSKNFLSKYIYPFGFDQFIESSEILYFAGQQKFLNKEYQQAKEFLNKSLEINKNNYKSLITLAANEQELNSNDVSTRFLLLKQSLDIRENYYVTHYKLALTYILMKDDINAEIHFIRAIELEPNRSSVIKSYADFLIYKKQYQKSIDILIKYENVFKQYVQSKFNFYIMMSFCLMSNNSLQTAKEYAHESMKILPSDYFGYYLKSKCLQYQGYYVNAAQEMLISIEKKKEISNNTLNKDFKRKETFSFEKNTKNNILYCEVGINYCFQQQLEKAQQYFNKSIEINKKSYEIYKMIMKTYYNCQKYNEFLVIYEQSIINTKKIETQIFYSILNSNNKKCYFKINQIESFMQNILLGNIDSVKLIKQIFDLMKNNVDLTQEIYNNNILYTRKQIQNQIYYLLAQKYLSNISSLFLLISYHKNVKEYLHYLSDYSIWDLFID